MYFSKIALATLYMITLATSPVIKRDVVSVIVDLNAIESNFGRFYTVVTSFDGSTLQALSVAQSSSTPKTKSYC